MTSRDRLIESFELQAEACRKLDSPMYAAMLDAATRDLVEGGPVATIVGDFDEDPVPAALPLRLMGGVHRLVLMGLADRLAVHYPSVGGDPDLAIIGGAFLATVADHPGYLRDSLAVAPQTNDIGRSAPLIAGLFAVAEHARRIRLLEIGSAGGLNLLLDRYRYEAASWHWGDAASPAVVDVDWSGQPPPIVSNLSIETRRGCDVAPIDVTDPEQQLRLLSFIWPDQLDRFERTRGALTIARDDRPIVDRSDAASWLRSALEEGVARRTMTVVQQSVMWQYLDEATKRLVEETIADAGRRASRSRPLAHVSFEPPPAGYGGRGMMLRVVTWPGGDDRVLGRGHPHGAWFDWEPEVR